MTATPTAGVAGSMTIPAFPPVIKSSQLSRSTAWIVLAAGLMITAFATLFMKSSVENIAELDFNTHCNEIRNVIANRLEDHARLLTSGAGFFDADEKVSREKWRVFSQRQKLGKQLPGIQGIGFSLLIPRSELPAHLQEIRGEGFPKYTVRPAGDREVYSSIIYLEPFSGRNLRAFGFDMLSEPIRREAMEQARDNDSATLSGRVVLVQETDEEVQAGTLMYVPVYHKGMPTDSVEQRRAAIYGWVYSPYRMSDLMRGMLSDYNMEKNLNLHLQVFDGAIPSPQSLLYECLPAEKKSVRFSRQIPVGFNGHLWTLRFTQTSGGFVTVEYTQAWLALACGTIITWLLFYLIRSLQNTQAQAQQIAEKSLVALVASEKRFMNMFYAAMDAAFLVEGEIFIDCNEAAVRMLGYSNRGELLDKHPAQLSPAMQPDGKKSSEKVGKMVETAFREGGYRFEWIYKKANGEDFPVEVSLTPILLQGKSLFHCLLRDLTEIKRAEAALRESEARFRNMADGVPVLLWTSGTDALFDYFNKPWLDFTGRTMEQELGNGWAEGVHLEDYQRCLDIYLSAFKARRSFSMEYRLRRADGEYRWLLDDAIPRFNQEGVFFGYIGACADITVRKQAEDALRDLNWRMENIVEGTHVGTWEWNVQTGQTVYNGMWARMIGYTLEELAPVSIKTWETLVHPDDLVMSAVLIERHFSGELPYYDYECRMKHKDGHWVWVHDRGCVATHTSDGKPLMMFGTHSDITARRQTEEALRQVKDRLTMAVRAGGVGVWDYDVVNNKLVWDDQMYRLYGIAADKFIGAYEAWTAGLHPEDRRRGDGEIQSALRGDKDFDTEFRVLWPDGTLRNIRALALVQRDASGKPLHMIGTNWDITVQKRAEKAITDLATAKAKFTSTVSHELRSPLATIKAATDIVFDGLVGSVNDAQKETLGVAKVSIDRLGRLINDVLVYQKIDAGRMSYSFAECDVREVVREIVRNTELFAQKRKTDFVMKLGDAVPAIKFDQDRIAQVLTNLLTNAVKYTENGSIIISVQHEYHQLHVSIQDFGPGIKAEYRESIFEPFSQAADNQKGGTGLGLAISKEIILAHHGKIWVESEAGKGSTFHFTLPI